MSCNSRTPTRAAACVALQAGAVAHQGEVAAFTAAIALIALQAGLGAQVSWQAAALHKYRPLSFQPAPVNPSTPIPPRAFAMRGQARPKRSHLAASPRRLTGSDCAQSPMTGTSAPEPKPEPWVHRCQCPCPAHQSPFRKLQHGPDHCARDRRQRVRGTHSPGWTWRS